MTWTPEPRPTFERGGLSLTSHDPRNRDYPIRALLGQLAPKDRRWRRWRPIWDQQGGTCVGHTWAGMAATTPVLGRVTRASRPHVTQSLAYALYKHAQTVDEWPGEEPAYEGTSTLTVAKATVTLGFGREYRWCFGVDDVLATVSHVGPVATGLNWLADAAYPTPDGRPDPNRGQRVLGGHETYIDGVDTDRREVRGVNSWGPGYGDRGRFVWSWDYLAERLADHGDACVLLA